MGLNGYVLNKLLKDFKHSGIICEHGSKWVMGRVTGLDGHL